MNNLVPKIKSLLAPKEELNKKQVALFLTPNKIEELDNIVKTLSNYSNGKVNRNILIEMAIDSLIDSIPQVIKEYEKENIIDDNNQYDSIICPSQASGPAFLLKNSYWEFVKLDADKIKYLKHLYLYVGVPYSAILYQADITNFEEFKIDNQKKYRIYVENIKELNPGIPLGKVSALYVRSPKYSNANKISSAKEISDII